jgi:hypothetical protein
VSGTGSRIRAALFALQLIMMQQIIAVAVACFTTVAIRLATLVLSIFSSLMAIIGAIAVMIRRNDASRGQESARHKSVQRKLHEKTHGLAPLSSIT